MRCAATSSRRGPERLTIGDAPVQGCDFAQLMAVSRTADILARLPAGDSLIEVKDFRLVTLDDDPRRTVRASDSRTEADYVRFDLADDSLLEPITSDEAPFRVTMYDPRALDETHRRGRHRYLVARELIEADVVFNVPKLKTHKKAGVTGALKNLVGINGHKAYLPHHRKGGAGRGGDAYPGSSMWKTFAEEALRHRQSPHRRPDQGGAVPIGGAPRARRRERHGAGRRRRLVARQRHGVAHVARPAAAAPLRPHRRHHGATRRRARSSP